MLVLVFVPFVPVLLAAQVLLFPLRVSVPAPCFRRSPAPEIALLIEVLLAPATVRRKPPFARVDPPKTRFPFVALKVCAAPRVSAILIVCVFVLLLSTQRLMGGALPVNV